MEIKELGHVVLNVRDLGTSVHFYRDVLGFREVARMGERGVMFSSGRTHHELLLLQAGPDAAVQPAGRALGLSHFAFKIGTTDAELDAARAELEAHDVPADHVTDHGFTHSVYLSDPDGNHVEIYIDGQPELWHEDPTLGFGAPQALAV